MLYRKHVRTDKPSDIPEIEILENPTGAIGNGQDDHANANGSEKGNFNV